MKHIFQILFFTSLSASTITQANTQAPLKPLVSIQSAKSQEVSPSIWVTGDVIARSIAQISSEQSGRLTSIVEVGTEVEKGDIIAKIDARHTTLQLKEKAVQIVQQQANTSFLEKQLARLSALANKKSTTLIELERVKRDLIVAQQRLTELNLQQDQIKLSLEKATIKAPFNGTINRRIVSNGEFISVGQALVELVDPSQIDIKISAPLDVVKHLDKSDKINVKIQGQILAMPVRTWAPAGDLRSRTFELRLDASAFSLMSGSAVSVALPTEAPQFATIVPRDALILREQTTHIVKVNEQEQAETIEVIIGNGIGNWIAVKGDISQGDRIVIRGGEGLKTGDAVRIDSTSATQRLSALTD